MNNDGPIVSDYAERCQTVPSHRHILMERQRKVRAIGTAISIAVVNIKFMIMLKFLRFLKLSLNALQHCG